MKEDTAKKRVTFLDQPYVDDRSQVMGLVSYIGAGLNSSYDSGNLNLAPQAIRVLSERYSNADGPAQPIMMYNPEKGYLLKGITIDDTGDIEVGKDMADLGDNITAEVRKVLSRGSFPLVIGGDHYLSLPVISAYDSDITVVQLDAHSDFLDEIESCPHGSVMRMVNDLSHIKQIIHCGIRGNLNTGPGIMDSLKSGNKIITSSELRGSGINALLDSLGEGDPVHLTLDVDFLDPSIAPGTGFPEPDGIAYGLARDLICGLAEKTCLVGMDICEYDPALDPSRITGIHLVNLIIEMLSSRFKMERDR